MELVGNKETTIAVLPFQMLGNMENLSPVIIGFTEDLIVSFSKFFGLSVISQYSTLGITDLSDTESISRLGADYLITGSFRPDGDGYRVSIQLIRQRDNKVVFAGNHDETLDSILNARDTITQQMVSVLQQQIENDILSHSYKKESVQLAAYENWLLGMNALRQGTIKSDLTARKHFEAALDIDPYFARAYSGISLSYFNEWSCQLWDRWEVSQKGAHDFALKAIDLDPNDYISLSVLGRTFLYLGDYERSEHLLRKSLRMNPNDANNLAQVATCLVWLGHLQEAEQLYLKARNLNPLNKDAYLPTGHLIYFELSDYKTALDLGKRVANVGVWTDFTAYMAATYFHLGQLEQMQGHWKMYLGIFQENINQGNKATDMEAVKWQETVNPYKVKSNLQPFWKHILGNPEPTKPAVKTPVKDVTAEFMNQGELWQLSYGGESVMIRDAKGLHDIGKLLREPEKQIHCTALMGATLETDSTAIVDDKAIKEYKAKINSIQMELQEADTLGYTEKADQLRMEYDQLIEHLYQVTGLGGKSRKTGSSLEKARSAVTWRIRTAIKKIDASHPRLGKHLANSIKTGTYCTYKPETPHRWTL